MRDRYPRSFMLHKTKCVGDTLEKLKLYDNIYLQGETFEAIHSLGLKIAHVHGNLGIRVSRGTIVMSGDDVPALLMSLTLLVLGYYDRCSESKYLTLYRMSYRKFFLTESSVVCPISYEISHGPGWKDNSCYMDSVITLLCLSNLDQLREQLFTYTPRSKDYKDSKAFLGMDDPSLHASRIQDILRDVYRDMILGTIKNLENLRNEMGHFIPEVGKGKMYNAAEFYNTLALLLPCLLIPYTEYRLSRDGPYVTTVRRMASIPIFSFLNEKDDKVTRIWCIYNEPWLAIDCLENKASLPRFILNGRYEMSGIVVYEYNHYICYFVSCSGKVYRYNDISARIQPCDYPSRVAPILIFYRRRRSFKHLKVSFHVRVSGIILILVTTMSHVFDEQLLSLKPISRGEKWVYSTDLTDSKNIIGKLLSIDEGVL